MMAVNPYKPTDLGLGIQPVLCVATLGSWPRDSHQPCLAGYMYYLVLVGHRESTVQGQHHPALGEAGIGLDSIQHCADLCHAAEEDKEVPPLLRGILIVDGLQHSQERPWVQLL